MATTAVQEYRQYIGGEWVAADGGTFEDHDPFTGDVFATVAAGDADDARRAVEAAAAAFPAWSQTPPAERQRIFLEAADILEGRQTEIVERARPRDRMRLRLRRCPVDVRAEPLPPGGGARLRAARTGDPFRHPGAFAMGIRQPVGVVGAIAPWNAALILSARSIAAPLALGNASS